MRRLAANYLFPGDRPPVRNGYVDIEEDGTVLGTGQLEHETASTEFYNGILCAALRTDIGGQIPPVPPSGIPVSVLTRCCGILVSGKRPGILLAAPVDFGRMRLLPETTFTRLI